MLWIAKLLMARNPALILSHAKRLATAGMIITALLIGGIGFGLWLHFHDAGVRATTNMKRDNADLRANARANDTAGLSKHERDQAEVAEQKELEHDVDEADADGRTAADDAWNGGLFDR